MVSFLNDHTKLNSEVWSLWRPPLKLVELDTTFNVIPPVHFEIQPLRIPPLIFGHSAITSPPHFILTFFKPPKAAEDLHKSFTPPEHATTILTCWLVTDTVRTVTSCPNSSNKQFALIRAFSNENRKRARINGKPAISNYTTFERHNRSFKVPWSNNQWRVCHGL